MFRYSDFLEEGFADQHRTDLVDLMERFDAAIAPVRDELIVVDQEPLLDPVVALLFRAYSVGRLNPYPELRKRLRESQEEPAEAGAGFDSE